MDRAEHDEHVAAAAEAERFFWEGVDLLRRSAAILRGPAVDPSPEAMKTEAVITRAIEALRTTGFHAPKR